MRITTRISSTGKYWSPKWPRVEIAGCYPKVNGVETFDEAVFRRQAAKCPQILIGSNDWGAPLAFGALLIQSVNDWMDDNDRDDDEQSGRIGARIKRRIESDTVSFCRVDITAATVGHNGGRVRVPKVRITTFDNGVVQADHYEEDFAMIVADFCRCYSEKFVSRGDAKVVFSPETEAVLAKLHERTLDEERQAANGRRFLCERHHNGQCSPCDFTCQHFKNGHCVEITK